MMLMLASEFALASLSIEVESMVMKVRASQQNHDRVDGAILNR